MPKIAVRLQLVPDATVLRVKCFGSTLHWKQEVHARVSQQGSVRKEVVRLIENLPRLEQGSFPTD